MGTDDAAGFWEAVPSDPPQPSSTQGDIDEEATDDQHPLAVELFGEDLDPAVKLPRRQATLHNQGSRFWGSLADFQLPPSHKRIRTLRAWQGRNVDTLFEDDGALHSDLP